MGHAMNSIIGQYAVKYSLSYESKCIMDYE